MCITESGANWTCLHHMCMSMQVVVGSQQHSAPSPSGSQRFSVCDVQRSLSDAQVVTDEQWAARAERFPEEAPKTREYYLLRAIFQKHFPSQSAYNTVPRVSRRAVGCTVHCGGQCSGMSGVG